MFFFRFVTPPAYLAMVKAIQIAYPAQQLQIY
jgi:hypothetical protein